MKAIQFIIENAETIGTIAVGVYEVVSRVIPTVKDYTIVNNVVKVINFLLPNRKKTK